jgi:hypothetical protein
MEVDFVSSKHYEHIAGVILGIVELKSNNRRLPIVLLDGFIVEIISINAIGLRIVCCSLLVWHVISLATRFGCIGICGRSLLSLH